ncbi:MAG: acyl-ACP--UDP-N-acetylglucosamine O-acyltransferase [Luteibacter sp.]|jgi:UDP-N-acetylglucosamine acyltransferase|uniref:acyl-ACP--UDP-N-acetylglucosamine O-acyltransferase n=1 Tax=Rhodanobacteraceae TaxID=1775411 RepID=UPI0005678A70|nr:MULTISPECIES: acyl-ACP--UDP-N-acetylglucosamine O-acyltransferase [Rhodanobacteraceae]MDQ7996952.1 acyl-ACP--UDP-N-acetylglucosamine O-acyltransferase [Luteibacter sp.]MDQ8050506.1 acyl-ACP--UDP-N-acetylglucosamine O-acyltransferase [Luteibacter sp.]MDR6643176.1 UDP-N-acetylglucosamine acyltransferase [Luteibacter sp. 1214]SDF06622.1 acyl-[acyl-carrier-protein]--UDP-N-acetylglucosamine O-acyltransferase [Dyella sp. 333MFSha]SKB91002.1 acyl-[acyl-carrier-protein]--UDP-N-acetylglucosamine O-a
MIHPSAQIDPSARIADNVSIGAFSVIGADVVVGEGTTIGPHVVIEGPTVIGRDNRISQFASIGGAPQDKKWQGERTEVIIGDRNLIREFVTINRGTGDGGGITRIGNDNWLLAYVHIAHDCQVGNHVVFSNYSALAGHAEIGDWTIMSGYSGVHQFCKVGAHAFIGMGCLVGSDVPPFVMMANETRGRPRGINSEGLKRRGFDTARIAAIKRAYRTLYMAGLPLAEAREQLLSQAENSEDVRQMLEFLDRSERSLAR